MAKIKQGMNSQAWFDKCVGSRLERRTALKEYDDSYRLFLIGDLGKVPITKRAFAALLRSHLSSFIDKEQVGRWATPPPRWGCPPIIALRSGVTIYGIYLKDQ